MKSIFKSALVDQVTDESIEKVGMIMGQGKLTQSAKKAKKIDWRGEKKTKFML